MEQLFKKKSQIKVAHSRLTTKRNFFLCMLILSESAFLQFNQSSKCYGFQNPNNEIRLWDTLYTSS